MGQLALIEFGNRFQFRIFVDKFGPRRPGLGGDDGVGYGKLELGA